MRRFTFCLVSVAALTAVVVPAELSAAPGRGASAGIGRVSGALKVGRPQRGFLPPGIRISDRRFISRFGRFGRGFDRFGRRDGFDNPYGAFGGYGFASGYGFSGYGESDPGPGYPGIPGLPVVLGIAASPVAAPTILVVNGGRSTLRRPAKSSEAKPGTLGARIVQVDVPRG